MNHTAVLRTPLEAAAFTSTGLVRLPFCAGLFRTARAGAVLESPVIEPPAAFDDLVGSWNADLPPEARIDMEVQVGSGRNWSSWYSLGTAVGRPGRRLVLASPGPQEDSYGSVAVDTLKLKSPALAFRYRLRFYVPGRPAVLRLAAVTVSDPAAPAEPPPSRPGPWVRELKVRGRSQALEPEYYRHDICSPTALAAVLEFWGVRRDTQDVAERVRDRTTGDFGDWTFNVAAAAALGLEGFAARLESLDGLAAEIAAGRPVVASLTFGPGELPGAPLPQTRGHLVTVTGFTPEGDVIIMDPAGRTARETRRVYGRREFHRAWRVNKRGLAYLLGPPFRDRRLIVGVPVADLWSSPRTRRRWSLADKGHISQLLYGETVTLREARGDWVRVEADEQTRLNRGVWRGYPGWMRAETLTAALPPAPNAVVRSRQTLLRTGKDSNLLALSVGTRLERLSDARVRLLDGGLAEASPDALAPQGAAPDEECRPLILQTAELFLGTSYYWGGRSGIQPRPSAGVDCSGLASLAYRVCGLDLPRDARDQKLRSRPVSRGELKPGDLVFLSAGPASRQATHVMIYTGGDGLIESRQTAGRVLRCTFAERFGVRLEGLESGQVVTDRTLSKPRPRRIFFGSFFL